MKNKKLTRHFHTYSVTLKTYNETPGLKNEMLITQMDTHKGEKFIDAMEHKKYPIFAVMYHPEYQLTGLFPESGDYTDEIAFLNSLKLNRIARTNTNRIQKEYEELFNTKMAISRVESIKKMGGGVYEYTNHPNIQKD